MRGQKRTKNQKKRDARWLRWRRRRDAEERAREACSRAMFDRKEYGEL